jgi:diamine N-acetyltransferase
MNLTVSLREISNENLGPILSLDVTENQKTVYPRSNAYSIAEGHYPADDDPVWIRAIYAGDTPVGFLMTSEAPNQGEYFLWRLMVGAQYQGKGYGVQAVELLMDRLRNTPNPKSLITSHLKGDGDAGSFYERLGFSYTGEVAGGIDHVMKVYF